MNHDNRNSPHFVSGAASEADRRTEVREAANGDVTMWITSGHRIAIPGRLLDVSEHGMRIEHMYSELASGAVLEVERNGEIRSARVIWNRIRNEGVESGFFLL